MTAVQTAPPAQAFPKAFGVWFKDLDRWDVSSFHTIRWHWPEEVMQPISTVLEQYKIKVDRKAVKFSELQPVTIHFDGSMSPRQIAANREYKMELFYAKPGDLVVSKIDLKNGAVGIVPEDWHNVAVTNHFASYKIDRSKIVPLFLHRIIQTNFFRTHLWRNKVGAEGRKEVKLDFFEAQLIPVPPLHIQQAIVDKWQRAQREIADATARLADLEALTPQYLLSQLGIPTRNVERILPKAFALEWKDLERWSVNYLARVSTGASDVYKSHFPVCSLGEVASISYGIQKSPQNRPRDEARPYLRVANVQNGLLDLSEIKHINVSDDAMSAFRLQKHDLLVCEGNSAELVGRPAIWNEEIPNCVHQNHILKARADTSLALPQFVLEYMLTPPARSYFRARAKFTTNLASINSNDLRELPLPIPPLDVQQKLVTELEQRRAEITLERKHLEAKTKEVERSVSSLILGLESV